MATWRYINFQCINSILDDCKNQMTFNCEQIWKYDTRQFKVVELRCKHHVTHFLFVWRTPTANIVYKRGSIHAMKCINGEQLSNRFCKQTHHESPHQLICVLLLMRSRRRLAIAADLPRISWKVGSVCDSNWIHILIVIA